MAFDILGYRDKFKDFYGDAPIDKVAKDVYTRGGFDKEYDSFDAWSKQEGIEPHILASKPKKDSAPTRLVKAFLQGGAEGLTTELPSMAGGALEFAASHTPFKGIEEKGRSLKEWAEEKRQELYGPEVERTGLERIVYEGTKMLAPSILPGGVVGTAARGVKGVNALYRAGKVAEATAAAKSATNIASGSVAGLFGLSQAQQTKDTAEKAGVDPGFAPYLTGAIEAAGEFLGTKYLAKLFRLDEADVVKRGGKEFVKDLLKTIGVEVGTEMGQSGGEAAVEKYSGIRPSASPIGEAIDVIGPTTFMTLLTAGLAGGANKLRETKEDPVGAAYLERLKIGAIASMSIKEGLQTGRLDGDPFTPENALEIIREGQKSGIYDDESIDRFKEKYPQLRDGLNGVIADRFAEKVTQEVLGPKKIIPAKDITPDVPDFAPPEETGVPIVPKPKAPEGPAGVVLEGGEANGPLQTETEVADLAAQDAKREEFYDKARAAGIPEERIQQLKDNQAEIEGNIGEPPIEPAGVPVKPNPKEPEGPAGAETVTEPPAIGSAPATEGTDEDFKRLQQEWKQQALDGKITEEELGRRIVNFKVTETPRTKGAPNEGVAKILNDLDNTDLQISDAVAQLKSMEVSDRIKVAISDYERAVELDRKEYGKRSGLPEQAEEKLRSALKAETPAVEAPIAPPADLAVQGSTEGKESAAGQMINVAPDKPATAGVALSAVRTKDGTIYYNGVTTGENGYPEADMHYKVIENGNINPDDIMDGGYIVSGKYYNNYSDALDAVESEKGVAAKRPTAAEPAKTGNLSRATVKYKSEDGDYVRWQDNEDDRLEYELNPPEIAANPGPYWEAGIRHKGWAKEHGKFKTKEEAVQWLDAYDTGKIDKDYWGPGAQFIDELFGKGTYEKVRERITPDNDAKVKAAITDAKQNGPSNEFRALFGGIDPIKAGTTNEAVAKLAKELGLRWEAPTTTAKPRQKLTTRFYTENGNVGSFDITDKAAGQKIVVKNLKIYDTFEEADQARKEWVKEEQSRKTEAKKKEDDEDYKKHLWKEQNKKENDIVLNEWSAVLHKHYPDDSSMRNKMTEAFTKYRKDSAAGSNWWDKSLEEKRAGLKEFESQFIAKNKPSTKQDKKGKPSPYGRAGMAAFKKMGDVAGLKDPSDGPDYDDLVNYFETYYKAGLSGAPIPKIDIHPQDARAAYEAGRKDAGAAKTEEKPDAKEAAIQRYIKSHEDRGEKNVDRRKIAEGYIKAIEEGDVETLRNIMNGINPEVNKLFMAITGLPARTQKEADASIRSLNPEKWDAWQKKQTEDREKKNAETEARHKEQELNNILETQVKRQNGTVLTLREFYDAVIKEGFTEVKEKKMGVGMLYALINPQTGASIKIKKKVEAEYVKARIKEIKAAEAVKPEPKESAFTAAVGSIGGGAADRIKESKYEFAYGETKAKSDTYYDMVGMFSGAKADRLIARGITIKIKEAAVSEAKKEAPVQSPKHKYKAGDKVIVAWGKGKDAIEYPATVETAGENRLVVRADMSINEIREKGVPDGAREVLVDEVKPAPETKPAAFGSNNKIFTEDKANKAREILRKKLGGINMGVPLDPEIIQAGIDLAGYYIEAGARSFSEYAEKMIGDLGDTVRPYLKSFYMAVRNYPGFDKTGMDNEAALDEIDEKVVTLEDKKALITNLQKGDRVYYQTPGEKGRAAGEFVWNNDDAYAIVRSGGGLTTEVPPENIIRAERDGKTIDITKAPATESYEDEKNIVSPINLNATPQEKAAELKTLADAIKPMVSNFLRKVDQRLKTFSKHSDKDQDKIISKAKRPEILEEKPWHNVEHVRDSFRFKTILNSLDEVETIAEMIKEEGIFEVIKIDTSKMINPKEWGWRFVSFDLRMPNGLLVEYYMPLKEVEAAKKDGNHALFEKWREKSNEFKSKHFKEYRRDLEESFLKYQDAWEAALARLGMDERAAEASWKRISASLPVTLEKLSLRSSAENVPTPQEPSTFTPGTSSPRSSASTITRRPSSDLETTISNPPLDNNLPQPGGKVNNSLTNKAEGVNIITKGGQNEHTADGSTGAAALEGNQSGNIPADGGGQRPGGVQRGGRKADNERDESADADRDDEAGGLAGKPAPIHLPDEGSAGGVVSAGSGRAGEGDSSSSIEEAPASEPRTKTLTGTNPGNYRITEADNIGEGTRGQKIDANIAAIRLVKQLDKEGRYPTKEEQAVLAKYVGWGGLKSVFDKDSSKAQDQRARAELESLLTKEEYLEAFVSMTNAHYTSPQIIKSIYKILKHFGLTGGNILEPTYGVGNFIGLAPEDIAAASKFYGSELDIITAKIGQYLYPDSQLIQSGFQNAEFPYGKFDAFVGNPPFGDERIADTRKSRQEINRFKIHNYCIAKSGLHLKPGGIGAAVVTSRFLDTADSEARDFLSKNFKFLGAIRLPNDAFAKNAGTEVTTDLVFLQRLMPGETTDYLNNDWLETGATMTNKDGETVTLNRYFASRPHLMIGEPSMKGTMYGGAWKEGGKGEFTLNKREGVDIEEAIDKIIREDFFDLKDIMRERAGDKLDAAALSLDVNKEDVGIGGFFMDGNKIYMRGDNDEHENPTYSLLTPKTPWTEKSELGQKRYDRIKGMLGLRTKTYELINAERFDLPNIEELRKELNKQYDYFVKEHGFLSEAANFSLMSDDIKIEFGLESNFKKEITKARAKNLGIEPAPASAEKSGILKQRMFYPEKEILYAKDATDGYNISLSQRGRLDLDYIAQLTGQPKESVINELSEGGLIYQDPKTNEWIQEDEYLSGNVKAKFKKVDGKAGFEKNAAALKKVFPKDVTADEIFANPGATWIPTSIYERFGQFIGLKSPRATIYKDTGHFNLLAEGQELNDINVSWENDYFGFDEIFNAVANNKPLIAYDGHGEDRQQNKDATKALADISESVRQTFFDWAFAEEERARELTKIYNDTQNTTIERKNDGSRLTMVGASPAVVLRNTQRNGAWRMIQNKHVLLDHCVGAGKTFTIIAGIMERVRMGLTNKAMIAVPNHLVGQWAADFMKLYPGARILAATKKDFQKSNRRRLFARIATGKYDAIIVGHSSFGFIPIERESLTNLIMEEIEHLERAHDQASQEGNKRLIKSLAKRIQKKREKIQELMGRERDNVTTFEAMGIDHLVIDESHEFKNLEYSSAMQNITGMGNPMGSKRAFDLYSKIRWLNTQKNYGLTFATGTPVSNSLVEMYAMLRYMNRQALKDRGLESFDAWANAYAKIESRIEYTSSQKLKDRTVMATFNNLPEMLQMYKEFADIVTMNDLKRIYAEQIRERNLRTGGNESEDFPIPDVEDNGRVLDVADATEEQIEYVDYLVARVERMEKLGRDNDPKIDNHLWVMSDARKMALDIRLVDPKAADNPNNKINRSAKKIKEIFDATTKDRGTQLVFCDLSTPSGSARKNADKFIRDSLKVAGLEKDIPTKTILETLRSYQEKWGYLRNRIEAEIESIDDHHLGETEQYAKRREQLEEYLEKVTDDVTADLTTADTGFSVYDELKSKLIDMGIPEGEIKFIHEANTDAQKQELFDLVNAGRVRVLIGSSPKMGAGMNAQERLVALHHLDAPWRPSDVEQREGRIVRQGNKLYEADPKGFKVRLIAYSTKNTFDAVMWQILARKGAMLDDFRSGKRSCEDASTDSASYSDFMAESTGNPAYKEKHQLENEIRILEDRKRKTQVRLRSSKQTLEYNKDAREKTKEAVSRREALIALLKGNETFTYKGVEYDGNINKIVEEERDRIREQNIKALEEYDQKIDVAREEAFKDLGTRAWVKPSVPRSFKSENPKEWEAYEEAKAEYAAFWENEENQKKFKAAIKGIKRPSQKSVDFDKLAKSHKNLAAVAEMAKDVNALDVGDSFSFKIGDAQIEIHKTESGWTDKKSTDAAQLYDYSITGNGVYLSSVRAALSFSKKEMSYAVNTAYLIGKTEDLVHAGNTSLRDMDIADKNAQVTLDNLQFKDEEALQAKKARFDEVLAIVAEADAEIMERRLAFPSKYIKKDRKRFGDGTDVMDEVIRKEAAPPSEHYIVIGKNEFTPVDGKNIEVVDWLDTFIWKSGKEWVVTEKTTGLRIAGAGTQKGAIAVAKDRLEASGEEKIRASIAASIEKNGGTPYYQGRYEQASFEEAPQYRIAYHGTPHIWKPEPGFHHGRPRLDKIGTGEGAAAYGWGWYSAGVDALAERYAKITSSLKRTGWIDQSAIQTFNGEPVALSEDGAWDYMDHGGSVNDPAAHLALTNAPTAFDPSIDNAMARIEKDNDTISYYIETGIIKNKQSLIDDAKKLISSGIVSFSKGNLYKLDIPDDVIPKLLDWDKPVDRKIWVKILTQMRAENRPDIWHDTGMGKIYGLQGNESGRQIYSSLSNTLGSDKAASEFLARAGIPGNTHGGVSGGATGAKYVIWDQKVLDRIALLERNGEKLDAIREAQARETESPDTLNKTSLKALLDEFAGKLKGISVEEKDGTLQIRTRGGNVVQVYQAEMISVDEIVLQVGYGRSDTAGGRITGKFTRQGEKREITLRRDAGLWTISHEFVHFLESIGAITSEEQSILDKKIAWLIKRDPENYGFLAKRSAAERRAEYLGRALSGAYDATTVTGKIIQTIKDIIDAVVNAFGIRTARGIERDIKAGRIYDRGTAPAVSGAQYAFKESPAFKKWFKGSKVVDESGKPLVVYKGMLRNDWRTGKEINEINSTNGPWAGFFTSLKPVAKSFEEAFATMGEARTIEVYLSIKNPYIVDAKGGRAKDFMFDDTVFGKKPTNPGALAAFNNGYDGIIIKNTEDEGDVYIPKSPSQVKSATDNVGTFDENNPDIRYSFEEDLPKSKDPKVLNLYLKDETDAFVQTMMNKLHPKQMTWLETILKSPEWFDHPQMKAITKIFMRDRNEIYHQTFNDLNLADDMDTEQETISEAAKALKNKGLTLAERFAGKVSPEYQKLQEILDEGDTSWQRNTSLPLEDQIAKFEQHIRRQGATEDTIRVWKLYRQSYDKALDLMTEQLRRMIEEITEEANLRGEKPDVSELSQTLKGALAQMKQWKGFYAPRLREMGNWKVQAYKEHGPMKENREWYREHKGSELSARRLAQKLQREGWKIHAVGEVERLPESVYQDVKSVATAKLIDSALEKMSKKSALGDKAMKLNEEVLRAVSDEIKARGFRSTMIHRGRGNVVRGFIEDPIQRHLQYINNVSGGIAKARSAKMAMKELHGEIVMGKQVGGIDPAKDPKAYQVATNYIEEQLRNAEPIDRMIGLAKSIATFKFLGFNLRSLAVNTTAIVTTAPAAIHQYALGGKGSLTRIIKELAAAGKDYAGYMAGKAPADQWEQAFLNEITKLGWDDAQYTREALGEISKTHSRVWSSMMDASMYLFGKSEQWNRGTTMLAAYRLARKQGMNHIHASEAAKNASDKAHGVYGKSTMPMWAMGTNPAAKIGQMFYVYQKFGHNYLQMLYDMGAKKHNIKGLMFATLSPLVLAGAAAAPLKEVFLAMFAPLFRLLFDDDRDPEKWVWDEIRKHLGAEAEKIGRHGLTGAMGVDISSSLSAGVGIPKNFIDLTGAIGGVATEIVEAKESIRNKQYGRAAEHLLPTGLANPLRAMREATEGATTRNNRRVWDEKGKPYLPSAGETAVRAVGFRSTDQATISERTWEGHRQQAHFSEMRDRLYERYRAWMLGKRDRREYLEIVAEVREYNRKAKGKAGVSQITTQSLQNQARRMAAPSKNERAILQ